MLLPNPYARDSSDPYNLDIAMQYVWNLAIGPDQNRHLTIYPRVAN